MNTDFKRSLRGTGTDTLPSFDDIDRCDIIPKLLRYWNEVNSGTVIEGKIEEKIRALLLTKSFNLQTLMLWRSIVLVELGPYKSIAYKVIQTLRKNPHEIDLLIEWCDTNHTGLDVLDEALQLVSTRKKLFSLQRKATYRSEVDRMIERRIFEIMSG